MGGWIEEGTKKEIRSGWGVVFSLVDFNREKEGGKKADGWLAGKVRYRWVGGRVGMWEKGIKKK